MTSVKVNVDYSSNVDQLKEKIMAGTGAIDVMKQSVDRCAASIGGQGLFIQANKLTAAIDQLGGVTKLTAAEQERASATLDKAIEKYKTMGMTAPPAMIALADSMKKPDDAAASLKERIDHLGESMKTGIEDPVGSAKGAIAGLVTELGPLGIAAAAGAGVLLAVGAAAYELTERAAGVGAGFQDMSEKTSMSVVAASEFSGAMKIAGSDAETLTNAVFMMEKRFDDAGPAGDKVREAVKTLGISLEEFTAMTPDQKVLALSEGFRNLSPEISKAGLVFDIFGKQGRDMLPTLLKPLDQLVTSMKGVTTWTEEEALAAEELEMETRKLRVEFDAMFITLGRDLIPAARAVVTVFADIAAGYEKLPAVLSPARLAISVTGEAWRTGAAAIETFRGSADDLPKVTGDAAKGLNAMRQATLDYTKLPIVDGIRDQVAIVGDLKRTYEDLHRQQTLAAEDAKREAALWGEYNAVGANTYDTIMQIDGATVEGIKYDLQRGETVETLTKVYGVHKEQIQAIQNEQKFLASVNEATTKTFGTMVAVVPDLTDHLAETHAILHPLDATMTEFGQVTLPNVTSSLVQAADGTGRLEAAFQDTMNDLPKIIERSMTGGGGVTGAFTAAGADMGNHFAIGLKGKVGDVLPPSMDNAIGGAIGSLAGGLGGGLIQMGISKLVTWIGGMFGPSAAELAGRKVEAAFEQSFGGFQGMMTAVGSAYAATGRGAAQAQADVAALMAAEKQGGPAVQTMIDKINLAFADEKKHAADVSTAVDGITTAAQNAGGFIPKALQPVIQKLIDMGGLTDDEKGKLQALADSAKPNFDSLETMASGLGISLEQLGPKFQQSHIDTLALSYYDSFTQLTDAGADVGGVLTGMSPKINALIGDALKFGTSVPEAMKPMLQKMVDMGLLTDGAGHKLDTLSGFNFDDSKSPLDIATDKLTKALDHLGDILQNLPGLAATAASGIGGALSNVQTPTMTLHYQYVADNAPGVTAAAMGGLVTDHGIQHLAGGGRILPFPGAPSGIDRVPIWAAAGESVLTRGATAELGIGTIGALNRGARLAAGGGGGTTVVDFSAALEAHAARLERKLERMTALQQQAARVLPDLLASAIGRVARRR